MKLLRYADAAGAVSVGIQLPDGTVAATTAREMIDLIASGEAPVSTGRILSGVRPLAPIPRPGKIFGSGINYLSHKTENPAATMPVEPGFFSKFPSSVSGTGDYIRLAERDSQVDYEVELAIVIGRRGRGIREADAASHIYGYTVVNDVSDRGVQFRPNQMDLGKGYDGYCPMGPVILTADEVPDVRTLALRSFVNGELRQQATYADAIYSVEELIAHASRGITLEPGDVITTGTPAGCAAFRDPPPWLAVGDIVDVEIAQIGRLSNPVVAGWTHD